MIKFIILFMQHEIEKETINRSGDFKIIDIAYPEEIEIFNGIIKKCKEEKKIYNRNSI